MRTILDTARSKARCGGSAPPRRSRSAFHFLAERWPGAIVALAAALFAPSPGFSASGLTPYLVVLNKAASTLVLVDSSTREVVATVPTGDHPHEVALSADGRTAYVANYGAQTPGSSISVIDLVGRRPVRTIDLGEYRRPHGIAVGVGGKVFVTCEQNKALLRIDPADGRIEKIFETGQPLSHMVVLSTDGARAFTANIQGDTVTAIDLETSAVTQIPVGKGPEGIAVSARGREVWVAHRGDGGLSIIDATSLKVTETLPKLCEMPIRVEFTPDGASVLVSCAQGAEVLVLDAAARKVRSRIATGEAPVGIQITPDSKIAYIASTGADRVSVVEIASGKVAATLAPGDEPDGMAWTEISGPDSK